MVFTDYTQYVCVLQAWWLLSKDPRYSSARNAWIMIPGSFMAGLEKFFESLEFFIGPLLMLDSWICLLRYVRCII